MIDKVAERIKKHLAHQIEYCETQEKRFPADEFAKDKQLTKEQMSGYYRGRLQTLYKIKDIIEEMEAKT